MLRDVTLALRNLGRQPGFTALAVVILALGIGGATAVFSVVNAVLLKSLPFDTADSLYKRILAEEFGLFVRLIDLVQAGSVPRIPQSGPGSSHKKSDLFTSGIQELDLNQEMTVGSLLTKLRALSTNVWKESAYFHAAGKRFRVRVEIKPDEEARK